MFILFSIISIFFVCFFLNCIIFVKCCKFFGLFDNLVLFSPYIIINLLVLFAILNLDFEITWLFLEHLDSYYNSTAILSSEDIDVLMLRITVEHFYSFFIFLQIFSLLYYAFIFFYIKYLSIYGIVVNSSYVYVPYYVLILLFIFLYVWAFLLDPFLSFYLDIIFKFRSWLIYIVVSVSMDFYLILSEHNIFFLVRIFSLVCLFFVIFISFYCFWLCDFIVWVRLFAPFYCGLFFYIYFLILFNESYDCQLFDYTNLCYISSQGCFGVFDNTHVMYLARLFSYFFIYSFYFYAHLIYYLFCIHSSFCFPFTIRAFYWGSWFLVIFIIFTIF